MDYKNMLGSIALSTSDLVNTSNLYQTTLIPDSLAHYQFKESTTQNNKGLDAIEINSPTLETYDNRTGVNFSDGKRLDIDNITSDISGNEILTVSLFCRPENINDRGYIFGLKNSGLTNYMVHFFFQSNLLQFRIYYIATNPPEIQATYSGLNINTWYHFVISFGNTGFKLYVDGSDVTSSMTYINGNSNLDLSYNKYSIDKFAIGSAWNSANAEYVNEQLNGTVSNLLIFNRYLTGAEITALYEADNNNFIGSSFNGTMNEARSLIQFKRLNLRQCVGDYNWEKYSMFIIKPLYQGFKNSTAVSSGNQHCDVYYICNNRNMEEYRSNGTNSKEIYMYSINNSFESGFVLDSSYLENCKMIISKQYEFDLDVTYRNLDRYLMPVSGQGDIYPHFTLRLGIFSYDD